MKNTLFLVNYKALPVILILIFTLLPNISNASEVNVYSGRKAKLIKPLLDQFQKQTGITVNLVTAKSGKKKYKFDIAQEGFAWIADNKQEKKMIKTMKKGSRIMITGYNEKGSQTIDHYSLLGFTKAYNSAKKNCS